MWGQIATMVASTIGGLFEGHSKYERAQKADDIAADSSNIGNYNNQLARYYQISAAAGAGGIIGSSLAAPKASDYGITSKAFDETGAGQNADGFITQGNGTNMLYGTITVPKKESLIDDMFAGATAGLRLGTNLTGIYQSFKAQKLLTGTNASPSTKKVAAQAQGVIKSANNLDKLTGGAIGNLRGSLAKFDAAQLNQVSDAPPSSYQSYAQPTGVHVGSLLSTAASHIDHGVVSNIASYVMKIL